MSALTFDTYKAIQSLMDTGVDRKQAEAFTQVVQQAQEAHLEDLATKGDIAEVKSEIVLVRKDMGILRRDLIITLGSLIVAMTGVILAVMQLGGN